MRIHGHLVERSLDDCVCMQHMLFWLQDLSCQMMHQPVILVVSYSFNHSTVTSKLTFFKKINAPCDFLIKYLIDHTKQFSLRIEVHTSHDDATSLLCIVSAALKTRTF